MSNSLVFVSKIQHLLVSHLLKNGSINLILPDGIELEIGIIQENSEGELVMDDKYCYVVATRDNKSILLDSYNLGLQFEDNDDTIIFEDRVLSEEGNVVRRLDVV
jgi:hypothetical protein